MTTDVTDAVPLYADRQKVYPKQVSGPIRRIKWAVLIFCLAVYYLAPWLRWDRGPGRPDQAFLIDMPNRRGYFLWVEIWPQEVVYIAGLLILAAVGLFFVTSLFGRLWCGYACPQTVWTDLFLWAERLIEGDRAARMKLDRQPMSAAKAVKKIAKHAVWLLIAAATGGAWVMYFNDAPTVVREIVTLNASATVYGFVGLFTATTYLLAGWAREQVCTYMCPWPRFQSAMVDEHTLTVTYRDWRGEKRGKHKKGDSWDGRGDCVDCRACVAVCPTGIDIRDGLQLECIGCGLCIDACNDIMSKVGRPPGLIAFDTLAARQAQQRGEKPPKHALLRPRTAIYAAVLAIASLIMLGSFARRSDVEVAVLPERSPLFVRLQDGSIRNGYTLKIANKLARQESFRVTVGGIPNAGLAIAGLEPGEASGREGLEVTVPPDSVGTFRAYVRTPPGAVHGEAPLTVTVRAADGNTVVHTTPFHGPGGERNTR